MRLTPMPDGVLSVRAATSLDAFADIWPSLSDAAGAKCFIFQTRELLSVWLDTIGAARRTQPVFARVDHAGEPWLLLALGIERRRGARVLTFLDGGVSDYNAPIVLRAPPPVEYANVWRLLTAALPPFDAAALDKMPALIEGAANPLFALAPPSTPSGHAVDLVGDWAGYAAERLHRPKDSRRKRNGLQRLGCLRVDVARSTSEALATLDALVRMKTRRYLELTGADGFERPGYSRYFHAATERLFDFGCVHLASLMLGDNRIAAHWGLVWNQRFYSLMLAHEDSPHARLSPGRLLIEDLIRWSFDQGLTAFDLGYGDTPWKRLVGAVASPLAHAALPVTPYGWAYVEGRKLHQHLLEKRRKRLHAV